MFVLAKRIVVVSSCLACCTVIWSAGSESSLAQNQVQLCPPQNQVHLCPPGFYDFIVVSRNLVSQPLAQQARNGLLLDQTLWNTHFEEGSDELHSSAHYLLDRLARRTDGLLELQLQTAREFTYDRENKLKYQEARANLDRKRVQAIVDYMQANHPEVTFTVRVFDPSPVGMNGIEAYQSSFEMMNTSRGVIPTELNQGLGAYLQILMGGGNPPPGKTPAPASAVSSGTADTPGSFGTSAPTPPAGKSKSGSKTTTAPAKPAPATTAPPSKPQQ